jgi:hypothetical protein
MLLSAESRYLGICLEELRGKLNETQINITSVWGRTIVLGLNVSYSVPIMMTKHNSGQ